MLRAINHCCYWQLVDSLERRSCCIDIMIKLWKLQFTAKMATAIFLTPTSAILSALLLILNCRIVKDLWKNDDSFKINEESYINSEFWGTDRKLCPPPQLSTFPDKPLSCTCDGCLTSFRKWVQYFSVRFLVNMCLCCKHQHFNRLLCQQSWEKLGCCNFSHSDRNPDE